MGIDLQVLVTCQLFIVYILRAIQFIPEIFQSELRIDVYARCRTRQLKETRKPYWLSAGYTSDWFSLAKLVIDPRNSFVLARYGDAEIDIIRGAAIGTNTQASQLEGYTYHGGACALQRELRHSLTGRRGHNYYYAMQDWPYFVKLIHSIDQDPDKITHTTLFSDINYPRTLSLLRQLISREYGEVYVLCNRNVRPDEKFPWAKRVIRYPNRCVDWFEFAGDQAVDEAVKLARSTSGHLFLLSIGPLASVMIYRMYEANPNNRYLDVGSALDYLLKGVVTREWQKRDSDARNTWRPRWGTNKYGVPRADIYKLSGWFYDTGFAK